MKARVSVAAAALALLGAFAAGAHADNPVLTGDVGQNDGFSISLHDAAGAAVRHLDPGTYTLVVHDHSALHNFDFSGPGVGVSTDVDFVGDRTFTVTLVDGTYFFQCDPHAAQMHGSFTVGAVAATTTTVTTTTVTPAPAPVPAVTGLAATIGPGTALSLRPRSGLAAGRYAIAVTDRSAADGFRLAGPGVSKATSAAFRGTVTWNVRLSAGRYSWGSALHGSKRHVLTISP